MTKKIILDGSQMTDREELHAYLKREMDLPDYYGNNLDALKDSLTMDFSCKVIEVWYPEMIEKQLGRYGNSLLRVLKDSAAENQYLEVVIKKARE
ncbi:barstar family protein [Desemzia incerta]|uniref:barstar family protein n=1 Tax=Desemzia incerta TaxID=82801 RepID=UPI003CFEB781